MTVATRRLEKACNGVNQRFLIASTREKTSMDFIRMALDALPDQKAIASTDQKLAYASVLAQLAIAQRLGADDQSRPSE